MVGARRAPEGLRFGGASGCGARPASGTSHHLLQRRAPPEVRKEDGVFTTSPSAFWKEVALVPGSRKVAGRDGLALSG